MTEHTCLKAAGWVGLTPLLTFTASFLLGRFPYPDNNLDGNLYLAYILPHRAGELGGIILLAFSVEMLIFVLLLTMAFLARENRWTLSLLCMTAGGVVSLSAMALAITLYFAIPMRARGAAGFGASAADLAITEFAWVASGIAGTISLALLSITWMGVFFANRGRTVLPLFAGRSALYVALLNVAVFTFSIFVNNGPWTPGATYELIAQLGPITIWVTALSVVVLRRASRSAATACRHPDQETAVPIASNT